MKNYVFKNVIIFICAGIVTILSFGVIQYFSVDKGVLEFEKARLKKINSTFQTNVAGVIDKQFQIIDFFANTTYPQVALELFYDRPFYLLLEKLNRGREMVGVFLLDGNGNFISHQGLEIEVVDAFKKKKIIPTARKTLNIFNKQLLVIYPIFSGDGEKVLGFLGGAVPLGSIRSAIVSAYRDVASSFSILNPQIDILFPQGGTLDEKINDLQLVYKTDGFAKTIFSYNYERILVSGGVGLFILILFGLILRFSLKKPITILERIVGFISENPDKSYSGSFPKDPIFRHIAKLLIKMNHDRILHEKERLKKTINERIGETALQVAHDICSPLSSLQTAVGYLNTLEVKDSKFPDVMNLLDLSAKRLHGIADGLLQKHKGDETQKIIFSLHKILDELIGEYQSQKQYHAVEFVKGYHSQAIEVYGDPAKLQRAFGNIIKNDIEAMEFKGNITIKTASENSQALISIQDTGHGMSEETLKKVLDGGYTEGKKGGHGIGMTVVRETVKEYQGTVWGETQEGQGCTFFVQLPLPTEGILKSAPREIMAMEKFTLQTASDKEPIVVVDDEPSMREQWRFILNEFGRETILCESYEDVQAKKITQEISKTAVVDYHFENSEKNGEDILRLLKKRGFKNLYLCTAEYWKPSLQKQAQELGVKVCPKPLPKISVEVFECRSVEVEEQKIAKGYKVLVIDDDKMIRMGWELMKKKLCIETLHCFENLEVLQKTGIDLKSVDIAFVDKNIEGSNFDGSKVVDYLRATGIAKIVLASGESEEALREDPKFAQADFVVQDKIPESFKLFFS